MKIVLVGATGFVGRHILSALSAAGHQVIATSRTRQGRLLPNVEWQMLDLEVLARVPDGASSAWLARLSPWRSSRR